jgi:hypothetical protein
MVWYGSMGALKFYNSPYPENSRGMGSALMPIIRLKLYFLIKDLGQGAG